ncbi:PAS domain S-box-containing protein [Rhodopseudomonas rhenobacensis]|uniref:histidine kinase n=1 Tax=Rhodopseudomonas rhenobacensis TaxID=87461 RepID=A0A7W8E040_9BRAD|nr:PAS domain S-box protein [Rhodopseudomonas rhenobacensis]MBB5049024.1 PAS domain S-box-containing protein [Rhodopseudomonas rhenobacensis]
MAPSDSKILAFLDIERGVLAGLAAGHPLHTALRELLRGVEPLFGPEVCCSLGLADPVTSLLLIGLAPDICPLAPAPGESAGQAPAFWSTAIVGEDGTAIGSLVIRHRAEQPPGEDELELAALLARTVALVIARASAASALREREHELGRVQTIAKIGGVVVDLRHGFRNERRSPEYRAIHGLAPDADDSHEDWIARLHPDDRDHALRTFLDAISGTAGHYSSEYRIIRPSDGQIRWIAAEAQIELAPDGRAERLVGVHIDITDRTLAKETLRESEQRFRLIADSAPVPMWVSRLDGKRAFANRAYLDFLGLDYEAALAFDWRNVLHPDDLPRILKEQIAGESSLQPFVLEARYRRADGPWRWMRSESQPRWDAAGKHIGFIGVAHDITASKEAETELRRLNETLEQRIRQRTAQLQANAAQMRAMFETTNQYQGLLDLNGNIVHANATALAGIRASVGDVLGTRFWDSPWFAATEGMRDCVRGAFVAAKKGDTVRTEMLLHLPIGDRFFDFAMRPIRDEHGRVTSVLPEAVDITERRHSEEALRQSQKMEAVGQLTGGVAHDFNNLLTIIRSATDFLRRRDLPEERRRRYIDAISETVDRASTLTGQLLAFARRQPLTPQVFNVGSQVESIAQLIRPLVGSRIQIAVNLGCPDCFALADVAQFETALVNLAVNGRDAMNDEGCLTFDVVKADAIPAMRSHPGRSGSFVAVAVTDTGSGIAPDRLEAIFEPFYTTKEVGKGTGLGLSQAFGFAKQSGGEIEVVSALGAGSTFTIYLPQAEIPADQADVVAVATEVTASGRGHRVLVVEDNEDVGRFSTELLEDLGYAISWVGNAADALAAIAEDEFAYDLVFSDVIMPGMNGVELATLIRERYPGLPVVLTSGYSTVLAENAHHGFELIQKPYSVEVLSRTLRRAIADRRTTMA